MNRVGRMTRVLIALALAFVITSTSRVGSVRADSPISVQQSVVKTDFPKAIDFRVQAQSTAQIADVRLSYQIADIPIDRIAKATFRPGNLIQATYVIDSTREYYPPGTAIHYRWLIQDQAGDTLATPSAELIVADNRFPWQSLSAGPVTVHWYQGDNQWVQTMVRTANQVVLQGSVTSGASLRKSDLFLYANEQDFKSALGVGSNEWVGGQTFPEYGVSILLAPPDQTALDQRTVAHELTHIVNDGGSPNPFGPLPTWLDEGMSMVAEGPPESTFVQALQEGVKSHALLSIQSISGNFPEDSNQATLAYAESESLVRYFRATYGQNRLNTLVAAFRQGATSDEAFLQATGLSSVAFQRQWQASISPAASAAEPGPSSSWLVRIVSFPISLFTRLVHDVQRLAQPKPA